MEIARQTLTFSGSCIVTITEKQKSTAAGNAWLFINHIAGSFDKPQRHARLRSLIDDLGLLPIEINSPAHLASTWADQSEARPDFIISVGGDGTAAMIAGITGGQVPIAIYPAGTENVLAKYLGIPTDIGAFARMIAKRHIRRLDAGMCGDQTFLLMVTAGFEAEVVHQVHNRRNGHLTKFHYVQPTFQALAQYQYPEIQLSLELEDGTRTRTEGYWAFIFNVPRYALGLQMAPEASPCDGVLDVCVLTSKGFWSTGAYITSLLTGTIRRRPDVKVYRARQIELSCSSVPVALQTDGDPAGFTDVRVSVLPDYLPVIAPKTRG